MRIDIAPKMWGIILQDFYEIVGIILLIVGFILLSIGGSFNRADWIVCWALGTACLVAMICVIAKRRSTSSWVWCGVLDLIFLPLAIPFYRFILDEHRDHIKEKEPVINWNKLNRLAMLQLVLVAINWVWVLGYIIAVSLIGINSDASIPWMIWFSLVVGAYLIGTIFAFALLLDVEQKFPIPRGTVILSLFAAPITWPLGIRMLQKPQVRYVNND